MGCRPLRVRCRPHRLKPWPLARHFLLESFAGQNQRPVAYGSIARNVPIRAVAGSVSALAGRYLVGEPSHLGKLLPFATDNATNSSLGRRIMTETNAKFRRVRTTNSETYGSKTMASSPDSSKTNDRRSKDEAALFCMCTFEIAPPASAWTNSAKST